MKLVKDVMVDMFEELNSSGLNQRKLEVEVKRYSEKYSGQVLNLLNASHKTVHNFNALKRKDLAGLVSENNCFFLGLYKNSPVSLAIGCIESENDKKGTVCHAASHPHYYGQGYSVEPLARCTFCLLDKGAKEVEIKQWIDGSYNDIIAQLLNKGFQVTQKGVTIRRNLLEKIPQKPEIPEGYKIRTFKKGDDKTWANLLNRIFDKNVDVKDFWNQSYLGISMSSDFDPEGFFFADFGHESVGLSAGISCAQRNRIKGTNFGILGWTGVEINHRRKKLGEILLINVLEYLRERGFDSCEGGTQIQRTEAIMLYEKLGFEIYSSAVSVGKSDVKPYLTST